MWDHSSSAVVVLLVLVAAPFSASASEGWSAGSGRVEPDTPWDSASYMWADANTHAVDRVYLNGFLVQNGAATAWLSLDGGSTFSGSEYSFAAYLGYWRDCNRDGYVGARVAPSAYGSWSTGSYPADSQDVDRSICPLGSAYNTGLFVDEFRWIGPHADSPQGDACAPDETVLEPARCLRASADARDVNDPWTRVWADLGHPGEKATPASALFPAGTFDDSTSTLDRADALLHLTDILEDESFPPVRVLGIDVHEGPLVPAGTWDSKPNVGACDDDWQFLGGPTGTCGAYPLQQTRRLVNDSRESDGDSTSIVRVFDTERDDDGSGSACDDTTLLVVDVADVSPGIPDDPFMHGSVGGTLENVQRGTDGGTFAGRCRALPAPGVEDEHPPRAGKDRVTASLTFHPDSRTRVLAAYGIESVPVLGLGVLGGPASPVDSPVAGYGGGPRWLSTKTFLGSAVSGVLRPFLTTTFADVGPQALNNAGASSATALPAGTQDAHAYGELECGGDYSDTPRHRQPNAFGWICSANAWWDVREHRESPVLGSAFDLRDVDCYDQSPGLGYAREDVRVEAGPFTVTAVVTCENVGS